jgi:hypothetical protein
LALGRHGAGGVVHRGQQVHLAAGCCASGAAQRLAVDRDRPPPSVQRIAVGKPGADRCGQGFGVKPAERAADGGLAGDCPVAGERIAASAERGTDRLRGIGGPFGDRGDRPRTGYDRSSGKARDGDQRVAAPGACPWVRDGGQVGEQLRCFSFLERTRIAERGQPRRDRG